MPFYSRIRNVHWLRDKQDEGRILVLEDESVWEVEPSDRLITKRWLRGSTVTIEPIPQEDYPYMLENRTEGKDARVSFVGEIRAAGLTRPLKAWRWAN